MKAVRTALVVCLVALLLPCMGAVQPVAAVPPPSPPLATHHDDNLSPVWDASIRQWATHIQALSDVYGLDPDFIAAVVRAESNGNEHGISWAGAVGLMGVMPHGPGFEYRPTEEALKIPGRNLRWGVTILSQIIRQSGGDVNAALAAYNGGWEAVDAMVPRAYAAGVLNYYGRAVAARNGISPDIASRWTIALEIHGGNVPTDQLLLPQQPVSGLHMYGEHVLYSYVTPEGRPYYVKGYAVPLALVVPMEHESSTTGSATRLEEQLEERLSQELGHKELHGNPRVLLACLPSLTRLRGRVNTRWFAPSYCPAWHR